MLFVKSGISKGDGLHLKTALRIEKEDLPALFMQETHKDGIQKYRYEGDITELTVEKIKDFIDDIRAGDIDRWVMSDPVPKYNGNERPHAELVVGKTWKQLIMKDESQSCMIYLFRKNDPKT